MVSSRKTQEAVVGMARCNKKPGDGVKRRRNVIQFAFLKGPLATV